MLTAAMLVGFVKRVASAWWFYAAGALANAILFTPVVRGWGVSAALSGFVAVGVMSLLVAPYFNLWRYARTNDWSFARSMSPIFHAVCAALSVVIVLLLCRRSLPWGSWVDVALGALAALLVWTAMRRVGASLGARVLRVSDPDHAAELVQRCDDELQAEDLPPRRRAALRLSLAHGLVVASARPGLGHLLGIAFDVLDEALEEAPPQDVLAVALRIVEAMDAKRERTGDAVGHEEALALTMEAARRASGDDPTAMAKAHTAAGRSWLRQSRQARAAGDQHAAEDLRRRAVDELRRAVDASPASSDERAYATLALAEAEGPRPLDGSLDETIASCRAALRRLWIVGAEERTHGYLVLADLLELRARLRPSGGRDRRPGVRASRDLALALRLCVKLANGEHEREARRRIPGLQEQLLAARLPRRAGRLQGLIYRRVLVGERVVAPLNAIETALAWATWAMERDDAAQAAEAWQAWVTVVAADLRRRVLHDKQGRLPAIQQRASVAARWMIRAGRTRDAVVALESARAVLLTDRLQRQRLGLAERLRAAGEEELATEWQLVDDLLDTERGASFTGRDGGESTPYESVEYMALVEHERLLVEISRLPGFDDVDPATTYADVVAAAVDGPLVLMSASDEGGFAIVVDADRDEPVAVELPLLTRTATLEHVAALRASRAPWDTARLLRTMLPWLWDRALAPLAGFLRPGAEVTLVAGGALGELPLHAAVCERHPDGIWRERIPGLVLRYAPNARMLTSSQGIARDLARARPAVLSAAVPDAPGQRTLQYAARESRELDAVFGARLHRPAPATIAAVTELLDVCTIWHFACHGVHDPDTPLASSLMLADGPLTLGEILARPGGRQRLAVLSACHSAKISDHAPDEVVGFPTAMLQAGVAGVVSCLGEVEDDGAMLLVLRFCQLIGQRRSPAVALAEAQAWLRSATNRELHDAFPFAYARGHDAEPEWDADRRFAAAATWALFSYTGA